MKKTSYYPRASFESSLELANAVSDLGGSCTSEMAAEKLGKKVSGAFSAIISAAVAFGLLINNRGQLDITNLFKNYKLAYTPEEEIRELRTAFLTPQLFTEIVERFNNKSLPLSHFEKLLIKEFNIPDNYSSRVERYFIDGAKKCEILSDDGFINYRTLQEDNILEEPVISDKESPSTAPVLSPPPYEQQKPLEWNKESQNYSILITGPNTNVNLVINDEDDLAIIDITLKKIKRMLIEKLNKSEE